MKLMEIAYPRYSKGQELVVSGLTGFQATLAGEPAPMPDYLSVKMKNDGKLFKNNENGVDWIITFDHDDGKNVYFRAGKNMWMAERDPFYGNVVSRGKNFLNSLVDKGEDEGSPTT